ncbi:MAG: hypothetical protein INR62_03420 [Rhodospirillales bacterium]|nr:hypothetical protein [Acetobacter sp.]
MPAELSVLFSETTLPPDGDGLVGPRQTKPFTSRLNLEVKDSLPARQSLGGS